MEPAYSKWLTTVLPESRVTVWPGSGHFPQLAHPDLFAAALKAFPPKRTDSTGDARNQAAGQQAG